MILLYLFVFLILTQFYFRFSILENTQSASYFLHNYCLNLLPKLSSNQASLEALACGKNFEEAALTQLYSSTGLIHLFVVSGSHLVLLQKIIRFGLPTETRFNAIAGLSLLFIYCAICQFNPPVMRSFTYLALSYFLTQKHCYWPKYYTLLLAGFMTLSLNFNWITSLSLQMSWIAALVLEICEQKIPKSHPVLKQFIFYFSFSFCFMLMGFPQLSTAVVCVLLGPALEYALFPLALACIALPMMGPLFEILIQVLNLILTNLHLESASNTMAPDHFTQFNWMTILGLHILLFKSHKKT